MEKRGRRVAGAVAAVLLSALAAGCGARSVSGIADLPDVTNAPAEGFAEVAPGSEQEFILSAGRRTYFSQGSAELDDTARRTLDVQADWLIRYPTWYAKLQGHADDPGKAEANFALSQRRAEVAMAYLVAKGVPANRLWAKGYGRERPVRDCSEIECTAQNRRVVTNLRREKDESAPD